MWYDSTYACSDSTIEWWRGSVGRVEQNRIRQEEDRRREREARQAQEQAQAREREELRRLRQEEDQERQRQAVEHERQRTERARALLRSILSPTEWEHWERHRYLDLVVEGGGQPPRHYRINGAGGLLRMENDRMIESWCVHPREMLPTEDHVAAKVLHLRTDDQALRRIANVSGY